jgi:hypothetical protein
VDQGHGAGGAADVHEAHGGAEELERPALAVGLVERAGSFEAFALLVAEILYHSTFAPVYLTSKEQWHNFRLYC